MDLLEIESFAKKYYESNKGSHDWDHVQRVYTLAVKIADKEKADLEVIKISALLHDIGRRYQDESNGKICHAEKGAEIAKEFLKGKIEEDKLKNIVHCIESHRFRGEKKPETKEAMILSDADKLDSIGAVGIGRGFLFAGEVGAKLHNHQIDIEKTEAYSKEDTAYREFKLKLIKIKDKMLTDEGKRIAEERHNFMVEFFNRLNNEVEGKL